MLGYSRRNSALCVKWTRLATPYRKRSATSSFPMRASDAAISRRLARIRWRGRYERRPGSDCFKPRAQPGMSGTPAKPRVARFEAEGARESDVDHVEPAAHQRMINFALPDIHHAPGAICLVLDHPGRTLVLSPRNLAAPDGKPIHQASRQRFKAPPLPRLIPARQIERGLALEMV